VGKALKSPVPLLEVGQKKRTPCVTVYKRNIPKALWGKKTANERKKTKRLHRGY